MTEIHQLYDYAQFRKSLGGQSVLLPADDAPEHWIQLDGWDEAALERRRWIAPRYLLRGAVHMLAAPGSAGKSSLMVAWTCALALGVAFSGLRPYQPCCVITFNVEDDGSEQQRRFSAALKQFNAKPADLAGKVIRMGPIGAGSLIRVDQLTKKAEFTPLMRTIDDLCTEHKPDVLILDPMVELHDCDENDNTGLRMVMALLRSFAIKHDLALVILHHSRKATNGAAGDPDSLRGASSIVGAARIVLTLQVMTEEDANKLNIPIAERRSYFRLDSAKANYAATGDAEWFRLVEYKLANGDLVAAAEPFTPKIAWKSLSETSINEVMDTIQAGPAPGRRYSHLSTAGLRWAGHVLKDVFGWNDTQAKEAIKTWMSNGMLIAAKYDDPVDSKKVLGLTVDISRRPGTVS